MVVKKELILHPLFKRPKTETDIKMEVLIKIGKSLDGKNIGMGREKDSKYLKLYGKTQNIKVYYSDTQLNEYIDSYLDAAYGLISLDLFIALEYKFDKYHILNTQSPRLIQADIQNRKIENGNTMTNLFTKIAARIKELKKNGD